MIEIFKDIKGYEGLYQVSNLGNVKSLKRISLQGHLLKERILKPGKSSGYLWVQLSKNGKYNFYSVHRLVAETFIPNPDNLPCINHRDEIRNHNWVENLEFCSYKYNMNYGHCKEKKSKALINNPKTSYPIKCLDLETNEEKIYPSIREAVRQLQTSESAIWRSIYEYKSPYKNRFIFSEINK